MKEANNVTDLKFYQDMTLEAEEEIARQRQKDLDKANLESDMDSPNNKKVGGDSNEKEELESKGEKEK